MGKEKKETTFAFAALAMIACFAFIMLPGALAGAKIHVMFLLSWLIAIPLCMLRGYTYQELQSGMISFIPKCVCGAGDIDLDDRCPDLLERASEHAERLV